MRFGGEIWRAWFLLYSIFRSKYAQDFQVGAAGENLLLGTINTVILLTSSYTIALSVSVIRKRKKLLSPPSTGKERR